MHVFLCVFVCVCVSSCGVRVEPTAKFSVIFLAFGIYTYVFVCVRAFLRVCVCVCVCLLKKYICI
jgi:hypothetical protein